MSGEIHLAWVRGSGEGSQSYHQQSSHPRVAPEAWEPEPHVCVLSFQWEKLQMTSSERRKIMCSVTFHVIAITCVVWSLYVLIDRTAEEIRQGQATGTWSERKVCPARVS